MATELHLDATRSASPGVGPRRWASCRAGRSHLLSRRCYPRPELIADWLRDGGYDDAIGRIALDDPDLADL